MAKFATDRLADLLTSLGERALPAETPDLGPAVGLVSDIGRIAISGDEHDVRTTQSAVGALRDRLCGSEHFESTPTKYLESINSHVFLAGAMWALSEVLDRRIDLIDTQRSASRSDTRKVQVAQLVSNALAQSEVASPSDLLSSTLTDGSGVRRDELSRAFSALLEKGWVHITSGDQGRKKFFALTPAGRDALNRVAAHCTQ